MKPISISETDILTTQELANLLKVSNDTIYEMVHQGKLPFRRIGRQLRFPGWLIIDFLHTGNEQIAG